MIDANVILDVLLNRKEFIADSSLIWKSCETGKIRGYVSTLTFANLVYIMRKQLNASQIEKVYETIGMIFSYVDFTVSDLSRAVSMGWTDFEDALQCCMAEDIHADYIVSRNTDDFSKSSIKAVTPKEIISMLGIGFRIRECDKG